MSHPINLLLVRHALSAANLDRRVNMNLPDQAVPLAPEGHGQAAEAGRAIAEAILSDPSLRGRVRVLCSPYRRTRETADEIRKALDAQGIEHDYREEISLREISFGLFDGYDDDELKANFPVEHAHYQKHLEMEVKVGDRMTRPGEFWARMPMGESRAEVADRVKGAFGTILRDASMDNPVRIMICVSHGVTLRAFEMQWMHHPFEWYGEQTNPANASVRRISSDGKSGYQASWLFDGFEHVRQSTQDLREDGQVG